MQVSVVVPVFNPGSYIEDLISSLARQTLPQSQFEVIFVDDGSTDDTPRRLDELATERDNVIVLHEPNSGWPGRPRNLGIDRASGKYVFFVDHDDWLGAEALERMTAFGDENGSDIVVGRQAGHRRGVAKHLFAKTLPVATIDTAPLMDSLTPHMMFRKAFLDAHGLRFPEGRRRLEDHVFVTEAYFLASRISILADYHCYFHVRRGDDGNAAYQRINPAGYYGNVREVVDVVLAHTRPGQLRDRVLSRSVRGELLGRLDGRRFLDEDTDYRRELFDESRAVLLDLPESVDRLLPPAQRVRAGLLRAGRLDDLSAYVEHDLGIGVALRLDDLQWADGELIMQVSGSLVNRQDGLPWCYRRDGQDLLLSSPAGTRPPLDRETVDCTAAIPASQLQIAVRRREDSEEWILPAVATFEVRAEDGRAWVDYRVTSRLNPLTAGGGRPLTSGIWDVYGRITQTGWLREARLGANRSEQATSGARAALLGEQIMMAYWTDPHGNLSLQVRANPNRLIAQLRSDPQRFDVHRDSDRRTIVDVSVPLVTQPGTVVGATLRLQSAAPARRIDLVALGIHRDAQEVAIRVAVPKLSRGEWQVLLSMDVLDWGQFRPVGSIVVSRRGRGAVVVRPATSAEHGACRPGCGRSYRCLRREARRRFRRGRTGRSPS